MVFRGCGIAVIFMGGVFFTSYFPAAPPDLPFGTLQFSQFSRPSAGIYFRRKFPLKSGAPAAVYGGSMLGVFVLDLKFFSPGTTSSNAV